ncbi:TetR/AcrR family transcriptional regulator [Nocardioides caldifontis]|uniref:TetR/AcrR family transcriptional regulator n=1 Tax=Nocardioides caldifontis TaxID=2588938 RepID=UPI0011DFF776|nr:TetR family transcriptional regulator [Nocardioides caldifontis]
MTPRQAELLDAAIETIGTIGLRGLTHRAVDDAAGLAHGSTSNHFRSRDALLIGVAERFVERERAAFEAIARTEVVVTPEDLGRTIGRFAIASTRENRSLTLARYSLLVEAAMRPTLQQTMREGGADVNAWALQWLRAVRSPHPERDWVVLANFVTGLVLHELAHPTDDFDPTPRITELIDILVEEP